MQSLVFRIIVAGDIDGCIRDGSAGVFRFDEEYDLTEEQVWKQTLQACKKCTACGIFL